MKGLKAFIVGAGGVALVVILLLGAYRNWKASLYSGLTSDKIADLDASNMAMLVFGILLVVVVVVVLWAARTNHPRAERAQDNDTAVDTTWRELGNVRPPQAQLQAPRYIDVPVMYNRGASQPLGAEMTLRSQVEDKDTHEQIELTVPYRYLLRFAKCASPSRSEWTGKPQLFYDAQRWFDAHGFLKAEGQTKVWRSEYPLQSRVEWLEQIEQQALGAGTRTRDD